MTTKYRLPEKLKNKEYRDAFVAANISDTISSQIFALRKKEDWSQKQLAEAAGMAQARISLMESPGYSQFNINTLRRLAAAFDVALIVRFAPFSELVAWLDQLSPEDIEVPSFDEEIDAAIELPKEVLASQLPQSQEERNILSFFVGRVTPQQGSFARTGPRTTVFGHSSQEPVPNEVRSDELIRFVRKPTTPSNLVDDDS